MAIETPRSLVAVVEDMAAWWTPVVGSADDGADLAPRKLNSAARQSMDAIEQLLKRAGSPAKMINAAMNSSEWILLK